MTDQVRDTQDYTAVCTWHYTEEAEAATSKLHDNIDS